MAAPNVFNVTGTAHWDWHNDRTYDAALHRQVFSDQPQKPPAHIVDITTRHQWLQDATGNSHTAVMPFADTPAEDVEAEERLALLARKYAAKDVSREERARLAMLNEKMDLANPRYTERDWQLLDDAQALLEEMTRIQGE